MKRDCKIIVGEPRVALGDPGFTVAGKRTEDAVAYASGAKAFEYHCLGAGCDRPAAAGFVANADDAFHG
jgi:hypothetical protein